MAKRPELMKYENFNLESLVGLVEMLAVTKEDGHLSLMRFTTGWKAFLGTPDLDGGGGRGKVWDIEMHETLKEALISLLIQGGIT